MNTKASAWFPIVFLTLVVFISVLALTLTNVITEERIEIAKREAIKKMLGALFPEMADFVYDETTGLYTLLAEGDFTSDPETGAVTILPGAEPVGLAFMAKGAGYGGKIGILVGLETDRSARGIRIISQQETPGLGAKITKLDFLDQFAGKRAEEIALARDGGKIDAITGATISSRAVVEGVATAISEKELILDREGE